MVIVLFYQITAAGMLYFMSPVSIVNNIVLERLTHVLTACQKLTSILGYRGLKMS